MDIFVRSLLQSPNERLYQKIEAFPFDLLAK